MTMSELDQDSDGPFPETVAVIGVKVRDQGEVKKTRTDDHSVRVGDHVILALDNDQTYGKVYSDPQFLPFTPPMRVMRSTVRKATEEDKRTIDRHQKIVAEGRTFCLERIQALKLQMKLVEVYSFPSTENLNVYLHR